MKNILNEIVEYFTVCGAREWVEMGAAEAESYTKGSRRPSGHSYRGFHVILCNFGLLWLPICM